MLKASAGSISAFALPGATWWPDTRVLLPGVLASGVLAAAAAFLSQHYGAPVMLMALLLGMAMNFLAAEGACVPGIEFTARTVLRLGVALLGLRITLVQIAALGGQPIALVLVSVALTIGTSIAVARLLGFRASFGLLSGGATAICGASAALAIAAALPGHPMKERATLFTVLGVSALSTLAMIAYPMLVQLLGFDTRSAGVFIGATIHDVAQVVGAGYSLSPETGDVATFVKLLRVAMLLPVIAITVLSCRRVGVEPGAKRPPLLPGFAVGFAVLVAVNSLSIIPQAVTRLGADISQWCLIAAVAALGTKTRLRELADIGIRPVALMVGETVFLAALVVALLHFKI
jgi:uncharacterized integral membrane protein (TIGR00698 family)